MIQHFLEQVVGDVVQSPLLQIHVDEDVFFSGAQKNGQNPFFEPAHAARWIDRIQVRVEGGQLERDIGTGNRPQMVAVVHCALRPAAHLLCQMVDQFQTALLVNPGFGIAQRRLSEQIDGRPHSFPVQSAQLRQSPPGIFSGDEAPRHPGHLFLDDSRSQATGETAPGSFQDGAHPPRQPSALL